MFYSQTAEASLKTRDPLWKTSNSGTKLQQPYDLLQRSEGFMHSTATFRGQDGVNAAHACDTF